MCHIGRLSCWVATWMTALVCASQPESAFGLKVHPRCFPHIWQCAMHQPKPGNLRHTPLRLAPALVAAAKSTGVFAFVSTRGDLEEGKERSGQETKQPLLF
eukprot:4991197-Amphidinium_carterae.1